MMMPYQVVIDAAPAYELVASLQAYLCRPAQKTLELGPTWAGRVRAQLPPALVSALEPVQDAMRDLPLDLLVWKCPGQRDSSGFLHWLGNLAPDALADLLSTFRPSVPPLRILQAQRDHWVELLRAWDAAYFGTLQPALLAALAEEARVRRLQAAACTPVALVEEATGGLLLEPAAGLERVVLAPQHHFRPWTLVGKYGDVQICLYPIDLPQTGDQPAPALLRLTRALAEEGRLRMLRFLADGPRTLSELVQFTGLAKSTVHHHLATLRASGLVRAHGTGLDADGYSLRHAMVDRLAADLAAFLKGAAE